MYYAFIADFVAILHGIIVFYFVSYIMVVIFPRIKFPNWYYFFSYFFILVSAIGIIFTGKCWFTDLENYFRDLAGQYVYKGSFIIHYLQKLTDWNFSSRVTSYLSRSIGIFLGILLFLAIKNFYQKRSLEN